MTKIVLNCSLANSIDSSGWTGKVKCVYWRSRDGTERRNANCDVVRRDCCVKVLVEISKESHRKISAKRGGMSESNVSYRKMHIDQERSSQR